MLVHFLEDEGGNTAIEYGLIVSLMAIAIMGSLYTLGRVLNRRFEALGCAMN